MPYIPGPTPLSLGVQARALLWESWALQKPWSFSSKGCLQKSVVQRVLPLVLTQCRTFTTPLPFSPFVSPQKGFSPFHSSTVLSPSTHIHEPWSCQVISFQLWRSFWPSRSISWVFKVIWPQYCCVWGMRKIQVLLLLYHLNSLLHLHSVLIFSFLLILLEKPQSQLKRPFCLLHAFTCATECGLEKKFTNYIKLKKCIF